MSVGTLDIEKIKEIIGEENLTEDGNTEDVLRNIKKLMKQQRKLRNKKSGKDNTKKILNRKSKKKSQRNARKLNR